MTEIKQAKELKLKQINRATVASIFADELQLLGNPPLQTDGDWMTAVIWIHMDENVYCVKLSLLSSDWDEESVEWVKKSLVSLTKCAGPMLLPLLESNDLKLEIMRQCPYKEFVSLQRELGMNVFLIDTAI